MGRDAGEPLQHFVALQLQRAGGELTRGKDRRGNRMGVQDCPGLGASGEDDMEEGLGGGLGEIGVQRSAVVVNEDKVLRLEASFVMTAPGQQHHQGIAFHYDAVVAAGAKGPTSTVEIRSGLDQLLQQRSIPMPPEVGCGGWAGDRFVMQE
ncbi:MAG: hypothetical protein R3F31_10220 [Verrucomicrobiales bacterium]